MTGIEMDPEVKQFKLADDGVIFFQPDATNPLPGQPVGKIGKGESLLRPMAQVEGDVFDSAALLTHLHKYIDYVLEPLAVLNDEETIQEPARTIAGKLHDALGILPRADLEDQIAGLDDEGRGALRARKVRLGPVLVYLPQLNKPAAVRLRALLSHLWHDKPLPAVVPPDGVTSLAVPDVTDGDKDYYRSIGYPVYGPRAIRVDMLDRLVCEIYDTADKGVFIAQHKMAEWLGCPIADLYGVLEALGHTKAHDPADELKEAEAAAEPADVEAAPETSEDKPVEDKPAEVTTAEDKAPAENIGEENKSEEKQPPQEKPELATFRLRKGKAYDSAAGGKKPFRKAGPEGAFKGKPKHKGKSSNKFKGKRKPQEQKERVISAAAPKKNEAASPFDVLKDLKVQNKD